MTRTFIGAVLLISLWIIYIYNSLVRGKNRSAEAWADIEVQLKRRYDLIPNIVEAVKGYVKHESSTFKKITQARTQAMQAKDVKGKARAENILTDTIKTLFAVSENYPDLKASQNFLQLQDELSDTENKIQAARRFYNSNVRDYNIRLQMFPNNMIASTFKFTPKDFFEINDDKERKIVEVKL